MSTMTTDTSSPSGNRKLRPLAASAALMAAILRAHADAGEREACQAAAGQLVVGHVAAPPKFVHGMFKKGVELSHTHVKRRSDADRKNYDIAIDNVFAEGYKPGSNAVPPPLDGIAVGDALEVCGLPFTGGMHWAHNNCGSVPTPQDPDGWVKKVAADGSVGPNLEAGQSFCSLWPHH